MKIFLNVKESERLSALKARYESLTDEEEKELSVLRKKNLKAQADHAELLDELRKKIAELEVLITDLFSKKQISAAAQALGLAQPRADLAGREDKGNSKPKVDRPSDKNPMLIDFTVKGTQGRAFTYRAGRIFESFGGKVKIAFPYTKTSARLLEAGLSEAKLSKFFTEAGEKYFATEDGGKELKAILDFVAEAHKRVAK